tara:strand:- start:1681 stop:2271 length:591 start_codon:yes stop_codon:yes gene_type:complete
MALKIVKKRKPNQIKNDLENYCKQQRYSNKDKFLVCFEMLSSICIEEEWGDPNSYARGKEIYASIKLGHKISKSYSGADAYNKDGHPTEYKSTIAKNCKGSYTGISVQPTWEEQVRYLKEDKILKYLEHYFNRFEGGKLVESWLLTGKQVYDVLLPKLKKKYSNVLNLKDPRLSADVSWGEIKKHGKQIIKNGELV